MKWENTGIEGTKDMGYSHPQISKEEILKRLRQRGNRITSQRELLIDIILESENTCCKEIYYNACKKKLKIGIATIYRFLNTLEEIGAIERNSIYHVCNKEMKPVCNCIVEYCSGQKQAISKENFYRAVEEGIRKLGIGEEEEIQSIISLSENSEV